MARSKDKTQVKEEGDVVVGLFHDQPSAEAAIQRLKAAGFTEREIGVAVRDREQQDTITQGTGTQAADGAAKGAMGGGVVGGVIGLLAGVGALVIPGVGPIIAGGALASTLAGAGIGAAAGGLLGALVGMGVPEEDAKHFERGFQEGGILVTVQAGEDAEEAREALSEDGADLGPSWSGYGEYEEDDGAEETEDGGRIELMEEELDVDTREVRAGEVRVGKDVVVEQRSIEVPVTHEEVVIERHPVEGREVSDLDEDEEIRMPVMEEKVDVQKRPVVREEVSVGKRRVQETRTVSEPVRREEARIESEGDIGIGSGAGQERRRGGSTQYRGQERRVASQR